MLLHGPGRACGRSRNMGRSAPDTEASNRPLSEQSQDVYHPAKFSSASGGFALCFAKHVEQNVQNTSRCDFQNELMV